MTMYNPQKLHPVSYVTSLINVIKNNFIVIIIFLFNIKDFKYDDFYSYLWRGIMTLIFLITFFFKSEGNIKKKMRRRNTKGEVILSEKPRTWTEFFNENSDVLGFETLMADREQDMPFERDLF